MTPIFVISMLFAPLFNNGRAARPEREANTLEPEPPEQKHVTAAEAHTIPYCVVFDWVASQPGTADEAVYQALKNGICYDAGVEQSYFAPEDDDELQRVGLEMCNYKKKGEDAYQDLQIEDLELTDTAVAPIPISEAFPAKAPIGKMCDLLRQVSSSGHEPLTRYNHVKKIPSYAAMTLYNNLKNTYEAYMKKHPDTQSQRQPLETPVVFLASGPPSSGKSLKFLSCYDFDLMKKALAANVSGPSPIESLSYEDFQKSTADYNVDRLVESSDAMQTLKDFENEPSDKSFFAKLQVYLNMSERLDSSQRVPRMRKNFTEWHENPNDMDPQRKQKLLQGFYWLLRKTWKFDDLNNAHLQRWSGMRRNIIYESTFAKRSLDWLVKYEIPKFKDNGYNTVVILLQVKLDDLKNRLREREKNTGQTPAPDEQVEADLKEGQQNFLKSMDQIGWGVMMSHVKMGKSSETLLASFRPDQADRGKSCIQKLAPAKTMEEWDLGSSSFRTEGLICEGETDAALRQPMNGSC